MTREVGDVASRGHGKGRETHLSPVTVVLFLIARFLETEPSFAPVFEALTRRLEETQSLPTRYDWQGRSVNLVHWDDAVSIPKAIVCAWHLETM
jgi:hypothetical protein